MRRLEQPVHLRLTLPCIIGVAVIAGIFLAFHTGDPHWLNRSGAVVAAIAAGAVLLQIKVELELEHERERVAATVTVVSHEEMALTPLDALRIRVTVNRLELQRQALSRQRLHVAAFVIASAMLGELLHGFGDLLMCSGFHVCGAH